jgi:hypothetical protein
MSKKEVEVDLAPRKTKPELSRKHDAHYYDAKIQSSMWDLMWALRKMRDDQLYIELGFDSLRDYIRDRVPYTITFSQNLLRLSDKLEDAENANTTIEMSNDKIKSFSKVVNDPDIFQISGAGIVKLADGRELSVEEYETLRADEIAKDTTTYKDAQKALKTVTDLKKNNDKLSRDLDLDSKMIEEQSNKIDTLQQAIDYISNEQNLSSQLLTSITTKVGAVDMISKLYVEIEKAVVAVNTLNPELKEDVDIAGQVLQLESLLKVCVSKIHTIWNPHFFSTGVDSQGEE